MNIEQAPEAFEAFVDGGFYRQLMRHQAAGVAVVASGRPGARVGLTATSVASLSDNPPKLLICVGRSTQAHNVIVESECFSVNFLARVHQDLAERFAGRRGVDGEARFEGSDWAAGKTGAPLLSDALASLDCRLLESHTFSTHSIFIGRVVGGCEAAGPSAASGQPLVYFRGAFGGFSGNGGGG